jgi:hypothetical protein
VKRNEIYKILIPAGLNSSIISIIEGLFLLALIETRLNVLPCVVQL